MTFSFLAAIYITFGIQFGRILYLDTRQCYAPELDYLLGFNKGNLQISEIAKVDMTWRNNLAAKWGFVSHLCFGILLLVAGVSMLPIKVTDKRGLFFIGS